MSDRILIGTRKGLLTARRRSAWTIERVDFKAIPVEQAMHDPRDGMLYAALAHGHFGAKLHTSSDGESWQEITTPKYPEKPEEHQDVDPYRKKDVPWSIEKIWSLVPGGADQPGRLWLGTIPGGVFKSDDHGASWTFISSLWEDDRRRQWAGGGYDFAGVHSIVVDPRDSARVLLAVSCGGVWRTSDDGATWQICAKGMRAEYMPPEQAFDEVAQDPHRLAHCRAQPDVIWCQHHNGIFVTRDNSESWQEVKAEPSSFGFAVAVHPRDPDTAWFVPAQKDEVRVPVDGKLVVNRTTDGGRTFETLRAGLPQEHAFDICYRHALAVSDDGSRLCFGTTTGSVFTSDDGGDSWVLLNAHLPPVYSVEFA